MSKEDVYSVGWMADTPAGKARVSSTLIAIDLIFSFPLYVAHTFTTVLFSLCCTRSWLGYAPCGSALPDNQKITQDLLFSCSQFSKKKKQEYEKHHNGSIEMYNLV